MVPPAKQNAPGAVGKHVPARGECLDAKFLIIVCFISAFQRYKNNLYQILLFLACTNKFFFIPTAPALITPAEHTRLVVQFPRHEVAEVNDKHRFAVPRFGHPGLASRERPVSALMAVV